jgi:hypothetical protein
MEIATNFQDSEMWYASGERNGSSTVLVDLGWRKENLLFQRCCSVWFCNGSWLLLREGNISNHNAFELLRFKRSRVKQVLTGLTGVHPIHEIFLWSPCSSSIFDELRCTEVLAAAFFVLRYKTRRFWFGASTQHSFPHVAPLRKMGAHGTTSPQLHNFCACLDYWNPV